MEYLNFFTDMHFEHPTVAFIRIMPEQALQWAGAGVYQPQEIGKTWQDMGMSKQKDTPTHTHGHTQTHTQTHAHTHTRTRVRAPAHTSGGAAAHCEIYSGAPCYFLREKGQDCPE